jgi:hypothetical protein
LDPSIPVEAVCAHRIATMNSSYVETISLILGSQWGVLSRLCADPPHAISQTEKISCGASRRPSCASHHPESLYHLPQEKRSSMALHCLNFAASIRPKVVAPRIPAQRRIWNQPRCCKGRVAVSSPTAVFFFVGSIAIPAPLRQTQGRIV